MAWDPTGDDLGWAIHLASSTAVVNLCGASVGRWPWTPARKRLLRDSRLEPTHSLVDAIASLLPSERPTALLNASTVDIYDGADTEPATEATRPTDAPVARLATDWEAAAMTAADLAVRVVLLRFGLVIARDAAGLRQLALPFRFFAAGPLGSGQQWVSWVAIEDAVGLIVRAIRAWDISGPLNVVAPAPVRQRQFAVALGHALGRPGWVRIPARVLRVVLGEQSALQLGSRGAVPAKAMAASYEFKVPLLAEALRFGRAGLLRAPKPRWSLGSPRPFLTVARARWLTCLPRDRDWSSDSPKRPRSSRRA